MSQAAPRPEITLSARPPRDAPGRALRLGRSPPSGKQTGKRVDLDVSGQRARVAELRFHCHLALPPTRLPVCAKRLEGFRSRNDQPRKGPVHPPDTRRRCTPPGHTTLPFPFLHAAIPCKRRAPHTPSEELCSTWAPPQSHNPTAHPQADALQEAGFGRCSAAAAAGASPHRARIARPKPNAHELSHHVLRLARPRRGTQVAGHPHQKPRKRASVARNACAPLPHCAHHPHQRTGHRCQLGLAETHGRSRRRGRGGMRPPSRQDRTNNARGDAKCRTAARRRRTPTCNARAQGNAHQGSPPSRQGPERGWRSQHPVERAELPSACAGCDAASGTRQLKCLDRP